MLKRRKSLAGTVERHPQTGAPVTNPKKKSRPVPPPKPAHYKKFRSEKAGDEKTQEKPVLVKHESPALAALQQGRGTPLDDFDEEAYLAERAQEKSRNGGAEVLAFPSGKGGDGESSVKAVQKPEVLMEDDETRYRQDVLGIDDSAEDKRTASAKPVGIPDISSDPEILAAEEAAKTAQYELEKVKAQKTLMAMLSQGAAMDPDNVEELCEKEPWMRSRSLDNIAVNDFGFVPNKFKYLASQFEEGTARMHVIPKRLKKLIKYMMNK